MKKTTVFVKTKEKVNLFLMKLSTRITGKQVTIVENGVLKTYFNGELVSYIVDGVIFSRIIRGVSREEDVFLPN
ncbi:hypothetical protein [Streptococcus suis]|uniref:hypothetical protein n=1 Tax=Streptococcus suis TaxID=1307 RepID=UPI002AAD94B2|nr:hypothetical protein [Streptococcus suis]